MRFAVVYSKKDLGGVNIVERFREMGFLPQVPIIELSKETIYSDNLNEKNYPVLKSVDFVVFASKHQSSKGEKSLCLHAPGNFKIAEFGGKTGKVCLTSAYVMKYLFKELEKNARECGLDEEYNVTLEVTHHGPLIDLPCCFIEVGSGEDAWNDKDAGKVIAKTILSLQDFDKKDYDWVPCIGVGGPHYAPNFNKIQLGDKYAISHIISGYNLPMSSMMLQEAEVKTLEQVKEVLVDWKGCGRSLDREKVIEVVEGVGLKVRRTGGV